MRKHSSDKIQAMLGRADTLARRGLTQADICSDFDISVMTLHRWRKRSLDTDSRSIPLVPHDEEDRDLRRLHDIELENQRLRNMIADLILEKVRHQRWPLQAPV